MKMSKTEMIHTAISEYCDIKNTDVNFNDLYGFMVEIFPSTSPTRYEMSSFLVRMGYCSCKLCKSKGIRTTGKIFMKINDRKISFRCDNCGNNWNEFEDYGRFKGEKNSV